MAVQQMATVRGEHGRGEDVPAVRAVVGAIVVEAILIGGRCSIEHRCGAGRPADARRRPESGPDDVPLMVPVGRIHAGRLYDGRDRTLVRLAEGIAVADSGGDLAGRRGTGRRRWAWVAVLFGAWIVGGLALVSRALDRGYASDVGLSPYHVIAYSGLARPRRALGRAGRQGAPARDRLARGVPAGLRLARRGCRRTRWLRSSSMSPGGEGVGIERRDRERVRTQPGAARRRAGARRDGGAARRRWSSAATVEIRLAGRDLGGPPGGVLSALWRLQPGRQPVARETARHRRRQRRDLAHGRRRRRARRGSSRDSPAPTRGNPVWSPDGSQIAYTATSTPADPATGDSTSGSRTPTGPTPGRSRPARRGSGSRAGRPTAPGSSTPTRRSAGRGSRAGRVAPDVGQGHRAPSSRERTRLGCPRPTSGGCRVDGGSPRRITDAPGDDRSGVVVARRPAARVRQHARRQHRDLRRRRRRLELRPADE